MNLLVRLLQLYTPDLVKKRALTQLFNSTASAFEAEVPPIAGLDCDECLALYAQFARTHAERWLSDAHQTEAVQERLYRNAFEMARLHIKGLRLTTMQDVIATGRVLYRILEIDLQGNVQGDILIRECYFSRFYSPEICQLMSAMDRGLFAGLSNGGVLTFSGRITEGQPYCRAHFSWNGRTKEAR